MCNYVQYLIHFYVFEITVTTCGITFFVSVELLIDSACFLIDKRPGYLIISIQIMADLISKARLTLKKLTLSFDYLVYLLSAWKQVNCNAAIHVATTNYICNPFKAYILRHFPRRSIVLFHAMVASNTVWRQNSGYTCIHVFIWYSHEKFIFLIHHAEYPYQILFII